MKRVTGGVLFPTVLVLTAAMALAPRANSLGQDEPRDFSRWEPAIEKFEEQDRANPPPKGAALFVGSSSIRMWDLAESFPRTETINRGFGGSRIADATHFAGRIVVPHEPGVVVLYAGDNDVADGLSAEAAAADFREFVAAVRGKLPETKIVFVAIKPSIARWNLWETMDRANGLIREECAKHDALEFVDVAEPMLGDDGKPRKELFAEDGLHLAEPGYALWARLVRPHLD